MSLSRIDRIAVRWLAAGIALLGVVSGIPLRAEAENARGVRQDGAGSYAWLSALWWQWGFGQPAVDVDGTNTNPILDTTGDFAAAGQENGIGPGNRFFFLAGSFGGDVDRTVTVPAGKALFFPVVNFESDNAVDPPTNFTVPELRTLAAANIDGVDSLYARLDGVDLEIVRTKSPAFSYTLPDEDSIYAYFGLFGPQFEGTIMPVVADGYWVRLPPLPAGEYLLEFGGANSSTGFSLNVTYRLTIE